MKEIIYLKGDATAPTVDGNKIIVHICNDVGAWGKGFVLAISKRWKEPKIQYQAWYKTQDDFGLGCVQFVEVEKDTIVANMIAQHGIKITSKTAPIRYEALEKCLQTVAQHTIARNATIHMPRIGSGLAGGSWEQVELIIKQLLSQNDIDVYVYDFANE